MGWWWLISGRGVGGNGVAKEYHIYNNERPVLRAVRLQKKHRLAVDH